MLKSNKKLDDWRLAMELAGKLCCFWRTRTGLRFDMMIFCSYSIVVLCADRL